MYSQWYAQHSGVGADGLTNVQWMNLGGQGVNSQQYHSYVSQNRDAFNYVMEQMEIAAKKNLDISKLIAAYPGDETTQISSLDAYLSVGGAVGKVYERQFLKYGTEANACALRVSMAMNDAGYDIAEGAGTYKGANGKNYILSSKGLADYISQNYNVTSSVTTDSSLNSFTGQQGIYFMQPISPKAFGALGHITIWNGSTYLGGHGYNNSPQFYSATLYKPN